jgi:eukaryotic-like serine/threonine-protein kinase
MNSVDQGTIQTLDSLLDGFEDYANRVGVDGVDLQQFVSNWHSGNERVLSTDAYVELLRVWMEYKFQAGSVVSVDYALSQFPGIEFEDSARSILEFERQRLEATWSVGGEASKQLQRSLPRAPGSWEDFDLVAELGEGAFARVYLARQRSMANRLVALKITWRKTRESQWLARLQHSAIVPIYSVHQAGPLFGVCMPYLGNTTLADLLSAQGGDLGDQTSTEVDTGRQTSPPSTENLPADGKSLLTKLRQRQSHLYTVMRKSETTEAKTDFLGHEAEAPSQRLESEAVDLKLDYPTTEIQERTSTARALTGLNYVESVAWIGAQLANALEHAHRLGIVHCDIKPANVLLAADGQPRLLDFNVAQEPRLLRQNQADGNQAEGQQTLIGGTRGYMAPEQVLLLSGEQNCMLDGRADIYALGAVLFELLSRRRPSQGELAAVPAASIQRRLRAVNPSVTPALAAIVSKCLVVDREARYQSATELYEDLDAHVHHRPLIHQREPSLWERVAKCRRRHPHATSAGSILSIAAVTVLVMLMWAVRLRDNGRQMALELDQRALHAELATALPTVSAAREYVELRDEVLNDSQQIANILRRLTPPPFQPERLVEQLPLETQLELYTYTRLFYLIDQAEVELAAPSVGAAEENKTWALPVELASFHARSGGDARIPKLYEAYFAGDYSDVIVRNRRDEDLADADFARWLFVGHSFLQLQQWADAAEAYTYALAMSPDLAIARFYRGISRMKAGRWEEAAEDFSAVKLQQPKLMEARFNLAQVDKQLGRLDKAEDELTEAIELGWQSVMGYYTRASLRKQSGRIEAAKADYSMALKLQPVSEADWLQLGLLVLRSDPQRAEQYFRECLSRFPNSRMARQNLAHVLSESLGRPQESINMLNELIELGRPLPEYYSGRAVLLARYNEPNKALADLRSAEQLNPQVPLVQFQLACGYSLLAGLAAEAEPTELEASSDELRDLAINWYSRALKSEGKLRTLATKDSDLRWLREQPEFTSISQAFATIDVAVENE